MSKRPPYRRPLFTIDASHLAPVLELADRRLAVREKQHVIRPLGVDEHFERKRQSRVDIRRALEGDRGKGRIARRSGR